MNVLKSLSSHGWCMVSVWLIAAYGADVGLISCHVYIGVGTFVSIVVVLIAFCVILSFVNFMGLIIAFGLHFMKGKEIVQPNICGLKQSKYQSSIVLSKARNANPWALAARFEYSSAYGGNSDLQGVSQLSVFLQAIKHLFRVDGSLHIQNLATQSYMVGQAHVDQLSGQGNAGLRYSVALKESEAISVASEDASLKRIRGPTATVRSRRPHRVACGSGEGFSTVYDDLGDGDQQCHYCGAAFWYGERLKGHSIRSADSSGKAKRVTMLAYYVYRRWCFMLYQTKSARLHKKKQSDIQSDYLSGLYDAISRGERDGYEVGGRLILPMSFTGGPRYMYAHYLDALAICRKLGNPQFFITFTCNMNWPGIKRYTA
ncbi:DNA helicase [Tanacetum coccineum]